MTYSNKQTTKTKTEIKLKQKKTIFINRFIELGFIIYLIRKFSINIANINMCMSTRLVLVYLYTHYITPLYA